MELVLQRASFTEEATEGVLFIKHGDDRVFQCYVLEDCDRKLEKGGIKIQDKTCIPRGTYEITMTYSNRFKKIMPLLLNVPQFTGIRIHSGNSSKNSSGCLLVGTMNAKLYDNWIGDSRTAYNALYEVLQEAFIDGESIHITIE